MSEHPSAESLQSFLLGELPPWEVKPVVAHLAHGCGRCEARVEALARRLFGDVAEGPAVASEAEYDGAIERAVKAALAAHKASTAPAEERTPLSLDIPLESELLARAWSLPRPAQAKTALRREAPVVERLLAQSRACRSDDPQQMVHLAERACFAAENLDPERYGEETVLDLQARTLAELANACRVADDLERADERMRQAVERSALGSGDPLLLARLMDILASLCCHRRELDTATELMDAVYSIYRDHGDEHQAGRALISKGLYTGYANDPRQALVLLTGGFERIDAFRDPELALAAVHNILYCFVELGRSEEARPLLERFRPLYERCGGRLTAWKLRWIEGKIAAGCGEPEEAARCFAEVRQAYEEAGLGTACALVSLDLAAVRLGQGKATAARELVEQAITTFRALRIDREALAALLLLREACSHQETALGMLRSVREGLKRIELGLRFEPEAP